MHNWSGNSNQFAGAEKWAGKNNWDKDNKSWEKEKGAKPDWTPGGGKVNWEAFKKQCGSEDPPVNPRNLVKKMERVMAEGIQEKVICAYGTHCTNKNCKMGSHEQGHKDFLDARAEDFWSQFDTVVNEKKEGKPKAKAKSKGGAKKGGGKK